MRNDVINMSRAWDKVNVNYLKYHLILVWAQLQENTFDSRFPI